jgi:hypothetical protein
MRPLSNELYVVPKAEILFRKSGETAYQNLGDADAVTVEISVEEQERYANNLGVRTLVKRTVTQTDAAVSMTLAQMSNFARAASLMADAETMAQAAAPGATQEIDMAVGGIYKLSHLKVSNVSFADAGGAVAAVEGVDFILDGDAGLLESVTLSGAMTVTYDAAAITSGHKSGVASNPSLRGELLVRGVNAEGPKSLIRLWDIEIRPASARALISETDFGTVELTGSAYPVAGKPAGYALGEEQTL